MDNQNVLTVVGRYDQIRNITQFVTAAADAAGLDENAVFHLELCSDEAATNIIEHAYGGEDVGTITVHHEATPGTFTITFTDHGRAFNPHDVPAPPSFSSEDTSPGLTEFLDSLQVGGLGIHFMRNLMDEVHYSFDQERGNKLTLVKFIPGGSGQ